MDKPSASGLPQKPSTGRRVRLIPATPRPEGTAFPTSQSVAVPNMGTSQPPETFGGDLYSRIIKEAMAKLNHDEIEEGETTSTKSLSEAATQSGTKTSPTSSSSLRFSTDYEDKAEDDQGRKKPGRTFEEIAAEVIREMQEAETREEEKSKEKQEAEEPLRVPAEEANRAPQEDPIREILDLTETDDEEAVASDDWKSRMEETVDMLVIENAEQNAMLKAQREQMTKMVDIVDRMISWMDRETQSSNQPSPAVSATGRNASQKALPDTNPAGTSKKRKPTSQSPSGLPASSEAKRHKLEKRPGSHGSQKKD